VVEEFGVEVAHDADDELLVLVVLVAFGVFVVGVVEAPYFVEVFQAPETKCKNVLLHQRVDFGLVLNPSIFLFDGELAPFHVGAVNGSIFDGAFGEVVDEVLPDGFFRIEANGDGAHELFQGRSVLASFIQEGGQVERAVGVVHDGLGTGGNFVEKPFDFALVASVALGLLTKKSEFVFGSAGVCFCNFLGKTVDDKG
jgi:hypothetical protein